MASTLAVLSLLDGPSGVDFAYCFVSARFLLMRRYLAKWPDEVPRVYRMLDLVPRGAGGHRLVHLLLASAAEIGFASQCISHFSLKAHEKSQTCKNKKKHMPGCFRD